MSVRDFNDRELAVSFEEAIGPMYTGAVSKDRFFALIEAMASGRSEIADLRAQLSAAQARVAALEAQIEEERASCSRAEVMDLAPRWSSDPKKRGIGSERMASALTPALETPDAH